MSNFSPLSATASIEIVDGTAPAAPILNGLRQTSNLRAVASVTLPTRDNDGSELTGLVRLVVAYAPTVAGVNPFDGMTMDQIIGAGFQISSLGVTPDQAGQTVDVEILFPSNGAYIAVAAVSD